MRALNFAKFERNTHNPKIHLLTFYCRFNQRFIVVSISVLLSSLNQRFIVVSYFNQRFLLLFSSVSILLRMLLQPRVLESTIPSFCINILITVLLMKLRKLHCQFASDLLDMRMLSYWSVITINFLPSCRVLMLGSIFVRPKNCERSFTFFL